MLRCKCGQFISKENRCKRCNLTFYFHDLLECMGSDDQFYVVVNNRLELKTPAKEEKKMGFFTYDPEQAKGFEALDKGDYDVVISEAKVDKAKSGNDMIKLTLTIRDDIDQPGQKRKVFDNLVATDNMMWKFQQVAKAVGFAPGEGAETLADFAKQLQYKAACVTLGQRVYNDTLQNEVKTYKEPTIAYEGQAGAQHDPFADDGKPIDISDDDLPF